MITSQKAEVTHHFPPTPPSDLLSLSSKDRAIPLPGSPPLTCPPTSPSLLSEGAREEGPEVNTLLRHLDVEEVRSAGTEARWLPQKAGAGRDGSSEGRLEVRTEGWGRLAHPCVTLRPSLRRLAALVQLLRLEGGGCRLSLLPSAL